MTQEAGTTIFLLQRQDVGGFRFDRHVDGFDVDAALTGYGPGRQEGVETGEGYPGDPGHREDLSEPSGTSGYSEFYIVFYAQ